jgi:hypothetical protein
MPQLNAALELITAEEKFYVLKARKVKATDASAMITPTLSQAMIKLSLKKKVGV